MTHRGDPVVPEPRPPRRKVNPIPPLIIGAVLAAAALLAVYLYYYH
jgi:hypothetical protein